MIQIAKNETFKYHIMKMLKFMGSIVYGIIAAYLLWLLFWWLTPIFMSVGWGWFLLYIILAGGFVSIFVGSIANVLILPMFFLCNGGYKVTKYVPVPFFLFFGFSSIKLPWTLDMNFGLLQWIIAISLSILVFVTFGSLIGVLPHVDDHESEN